MTFCCPTFCCQPFQIRLVELSSLSSEDHVPFAYYNNLSRRDQATYRRSDAIAAVDLPGAAELRPVVEAVAVALRTEDQGRVAREAKRLCAGITRALQAPRVEVRVLKRRPSSESEELHGSYTTDDDRTPIIRVWMRTAAKGQVVKARTFLRTLLHELCHHLDYELFGLAESFHTDGFFRRESSLCRQLLPAAEPQGGAGAETTAAPVAAATATATATAAAPGRRKPVQLELPVGRKA